VSESITVSMTFSRDEAMALLGGLMSDASENCYCAGWLVGCEDDIPYVCRRILAGAGPNELGLWGLINALDARLMVSIAEGLGHWVDYGGKPYTPKPSYLEAQP
jgi:hypothetical protein